MDHLQAAIAKQVNFSLHFSHHVAIKESPSSNFVFSPLSIHVVLAVLAAGSKGETLHQLTSFLASTTVADLSSLASHIATHIFSDASASGGPTVSIANGVWVDQSLTLKTSFKEIVRSSFRADVQSLDFQNQADEAAACVNSWAENETNGLVKDLLPPGAVDNFTRLVLANAIYFKGAWTDAFEPSLTKDDEFKLLDGNSVQAPFMSSFKRQFIASFPDFKVLRLTYSPGEHFREHWLPCPEMPGLLTLTTIFNPNPDRRRFSMYIFLPDSRDGLWNLSEKLSSGSEFLNRHIPTETVLVGDFRIPKFKIGYQFEASSTLMEMGVTLPFDAGQADLTEMVDSADKLSVSRISHKSIITVDEKGTEAAAATVAEILAGCSLRPPKEKRIDFVADHPFLFMIREDKTGVIMFTGHLLNPALPA